MHIIWSQPESVSMRWALRADADVWDGGLGVLQQKIAAVQADIGTGSNAKLSGASWFAVKTLFVERVLPLVETGRCACASIIRQLDEWAGFEQPLVADGVYLDEDAMERVVEALDVAIRSLQTFMVPIRGAGGFHVPDNSAQIAALNAQVAALRDAIDDLRLFDSQMAGLFSDEIALSQTIAYAVASLGAGSLSAIGVYSPPPGDHEPWLDDLIIYSGTHPYSPQPVFSTLPGRYGGDQGSLSYSWKSMTAEEKQQIAAIIRAYFPNLTYDQIAQVLAQMNNTGCMYVADVNSLMLAFQGRPKEFYQKFGFPMYKPDGAVNFDALFAAFWCFTQQRVGADPTGQAGDLAPITLSLTVDSWPAFLATHGIQAALTYVATSTSIDDYFRLSNLGPVIIGIGGPIKLYNNDGSLALDSDEGAHVVTVVGTGSDPLRGDYYVVSSWGGQYRVFLDDYPPGHMDMGVYTYG